MNRFSTFRKGDRVTVSYSVAGYEFDARFESAYPEGSDKFGLAVVIDMDDNAWDVEYVDIWSADVDDDPDPFRNDAEADADALASAGLGTDEDYEHGNFDDGDCGLADGD